MSLTNPSLASIVKKQYKFKLKSYIGMFNSLVMLQGLAILFSLGSTGSHGSSNSWISVNINYYSADTVIFFTILWGFISAIIITTKDYREDDFLLITNRLSSNLSNIAFLFTASIVGGVTAVLSGFLIRVLMFFVFDATTIYSGGAATLDEHAIGTIATIMFIFLLSALGYLIGTVVQLHRILVVLVPILIIGFLLAQGSILKEFLLMDLAEFYFNESNFLIFICKIIISSGLLFTGASVVANRLEVKR